MGFWDLIHLNSSAYSQRAKALSDDELKSNIRRKSRQMISTGLGMGGGIGGAFFTLGAGIMSAVYSARSLYVAAQKHTLLRAEWFRRGLGHVSIGMRKRDLIGSCITGIVTGMATIVLPLKLMITTGASRAVNQGVDLLLA
ncbi:hypothetical protein FRB95_001487 [Tulasnella sp. JGI-2019a]|nr:hypothetical protein FRB95_001487 [Tulasnella sp. JGI-2019a]